MIGFMAVLLWVRQFILHSTCRLIAPAGKKVQKQAAFLRRTAPGGLRAFYGLASGMLGPYTSSMKCVLTLLLGLALFGPLAEAETRVVLVAGRPSHGPGDHEFRAGCLLLQHCLNELGDVQAEVYSNGWPHVENAFAGADAVVIYADGGGNHPAIQPDHMKVLDQLADQGVGLGFMHYAVEVPKGDPGAAMHRWIGGYYEHLYSVNPMWSPSFESLPNHPVTRGVKPFSVEDEWYFNMRWREDDQKVTPILVATPSQDVRDGPYVYPRGPYPHIVEAQGRPETMLWVFERPKGGRGFGFTGGHKHRNWGDPNYRKAVLNAILWSAKKEVPSNGVHCELRDEALAENLDPKRR